MAREDEAGFLALFSTRQFDDNLRLRPDWRELALGKGHLKIDPDA